MPDHLSALWREAEDHLADFQRYARRTVAEAWLAGDALMRVKDQFPHGAWRSGLEERGISKSTAQRFISLRKKYPEMPQIGTFSSVSAAQMGKPQKEKPPEPQLQQVPPPPEPQEEETPIHAEEQPAAQACMEEPPPAQAQEEQPPARAAPGPAVQPGATAISAQ